MRIGFVVPTELESANIHQLNQHVTCAGFGAGKAAACAAAAKLIYERHCDTIIIWGLAGGMSHKVNVNDIVVGSGVAYRDYNIFPLCGSTGVGWTWHFTDKNLFFELDPGLRLMLMAQLKKVFPDRKVIEGKVCTGDQFVELKPGDARNRIEMEADIVDMESAAVAHFCHALAPNLKVGIVRVISDNADHNANVDFTAFLGAFSQMNTELYQLRTGLLKAAGGDDVAEAIRDYPDFPVKGVLFKDIWGILYDRDIFDSACHKMYDMFKSHHPEAVVTKVAGVESRGFIFGFELARMLKVPFIPLRKKGKLPGRVVSHTYKTEYSESCLEAQRSAFVPGDRVLLVDDIIATGGSLLAAQNVIGQCGAKCEYCLAVGQINGLNGAKLLKDHGIAATYLLDL